MEDMAFIILVCFVILLVSSWIFLKYQKKYRFPPGQRGIPILGNFLQLDMRKFSMEMCTIGEEFDEAYTVKLLNDKCVILKSYGIIREALMSEKYAKVFSGRPKTFIGEYVLPKDVAMQTYSEEWAARRKLVFRGLKMYGAHMREVEDLVQEELKDLVARIQNIGDKAVDPYDFISGYLISILLMLLTGEHIKHGDPLLQVCGKLVEHMNIVMGPGPSALMTLFPWIRHIPLGYGKVYQQVKSEVSILFQTVYERRKNNMNRKPCFLDFLLDEKTKDNLNDDSLPSIFLDVFGAGTGTSRSFLYSLLLTLTARPDIQKKVQEEIDREIGRSRLPCAEDKQRLPFTQAVLFESFRHCSVVPLPLPHCTMDDVKIRDYYLPKDTMIFYSIWDVNHDDTFWEDPWTFNPDRFLDSEGNVVPPSDEKRQRTITFGLGKRQCIGETLARLRSFLALVTILQRFNLLPDPEFHLPDTDPRTFDCHVTMVAPRYKIVFQSRASR